MHFTQVYIVRADYDFLGLHPSKRNTVAAWYCHCSAGSSAASSTSLHSKVTAGTCCGSLGSSAAHRHQHQRSCPWLWTCDTQATDFGCIEAVTAHLKLCSTMFMPHEGAQGVKTVQHNSVTCAWRSFASGRSGSGEKRHIPCRLIDIKSKAMQVLARKDFSILGILGYLWLK